MLLDSSQVLDLGTGLVPRLVNAKKITSLPSPLQWMMGKAELRRE